MDPIREIRFMELLRDDPSAILLIKEKYLNDRLWEVAIKNEPSLFQYMKNPSDSLIMLALREDGANIKYLLKMNIEITPERLHVALKNYPGAIFLIPKRYRTNGVKEFACMEDPTLMKDVELREEFIKRRLKQDPLLVRFLKNPTEDQLCDALEYSANICGYIETFTPRMKEIMLRKYPDMIQLIPRLRDNL